MSPKAISPPNGYAFDEKAEYRRAIYSAVKSTTFLLPLQAEVGMLESTQGLEIETALRFGFSEKRLHVINASPAVVATLKRKYPKINTYGRIASDACEVMRQRGVRLDVLNLDLTSNMGPSTSSEIVGVAWSGVLAPKSLVAINILRGRETCFGVLESSGRKHRDMVMRDLCRVSGYALNDADFGRLLGATAPFIYTHNFAIRRIGSYLNPTAKQTMLWVLLRLEQCSPAEQSRRLMDLKAWQDSHPSPN